MFQIRLPSSPGVVCWLASGLTACGGLGADSDERQASKPQDARRHDDSNMLEFRAPAGELPAVRNIEIDGQDAAVLPNGRLLTPAGNEIDVQAPAPYGLALSPDGKVLATINSGASRFSVSLVRDWASAQPKVERVDVDASFMGVAFSPDSARFYLSGGENGNLWIGDTAANRIVGSVNLNGPERPLDRPLAPNIPPARRFKGTFPGNLALTRDGRHLYVVDQASFRVHVLDTSVLQLGVDDQNRVIEPDNFSAVVARYDVGRYPYGISLSPDDRTLFVSHVGVFEYSHLRPAAPTGDPNQDYPLCYPGAGYPDETETDRIIRISPVDPRDPPASQRDPLGIRCGYVTTDRLFTVPGLGSPNAPESSSVYVLDVSAPAAPLERARLKPGLLVGEVEQGVSTYGGSHPNSISVGDRFVYVANGAQDSISVFDRGSLEKRRDVRLSLLRGIDRRLKGLQPVALQLSPDGEHLYVAEAGINAVAVLRVAGDSLEVEGHIPVGWWPSSLQLSADGKTLLVANAKGRGAGPNDVIGSELGTPKHTTLGTVNVVPVPDPEQLGVLTRRVLENNGFVPRPEPGDLASSDHPIPHQLGQRSRQINHVVFINKENATFDILLGDITSTRRGEAVDGEPLYSLGLDASPNHHELALGFAFADNFYLEPSVSSDGHRWLTNTYTSEFMETHWPASYGGRRRDSGDDPAVFVDYPGRLGFTDANSSPEPQDYNQHGGIYLHLARNGQTFVNFGNGYEFAIVDEAGDTEPTGIREHVNVPMEKIVRDNSDHLFPEYNTHIPDAPLPEDPGRFSRFGRFKQVFENEYVDRERGVCKLPGYVDLYYPNDHGGGARDINPNGPDWSFRRFVQDNDAALGLTVDLISHSPCWHDTVIFVVEDDTQNGPDHVDGHRSILLAISPWVKREHVSRTHLSLASVFKTVHAIFGLPALNQYDAAATDLRDLFTDAPDFTPYSYAPVSFDARPNTTWSTLSAEIDFSTPDADEVRLRSAILTSEGLPKLGPPAPPSNTAPMPPSHSRKVQHP